MKDRTPSQADLAELLLDLRRASLYHLPIGLSFVTFDLMLLLYWAETQGRSGVVIKELFAGLPYSPMGMRYHLRRLISEGWVETGSSTQDKRTRLLRLSTKSIAAFESISREASRSLRPRYLKLLL